MLIEQLRQKSSSIDDRIGRDEFMSQIKEDGSNLQEIEEILMGIHIAEYMLKDNVRTLLSFYNSDIVLKNIDSIDNLLHTFKWFIEDQEPIYLREKAKTDKETKEVYEALKPSSICEMMNISYDRLYSEVVALYYIRFDILIHELANNIIKYRKEKGFKNLNYKDIIDELNDIYEVYFFNENKKLSNSVDIAKLREFYFEHESREKAKRLKQTKNNRIKKKNKIILKYIQNNLKGLSCLCFNSEISIDMSKIL